MIHVLDACAIIAFLRDEAGAVVVEKILSEEPPTCMVHAVNLCEVYYDFVKRSGEEAAAAAIDLIRSIGVIVREDMDEAFWQQAGRYKARFRIALGDAFALSLADRFGAKIVTSDRADFEPVLQAGACSVAFIRP
jgi:PIN domain nuclease of toxin-antitoxin system